MSCGRILAAIPLPAASGTAGEDADDAGTFAVGSLVAAAAACWSVQLKPSALRCCFDVSKMLRVTDQTHQPRHFAALRPHHDCREARMMQAPSKIGQRAPRLPYLPQNSVCLVDSSSGLAEFWQRPSAADSFFAQRIAQFNATLEAHSRIFRHAFRLPLQPRRYRGSIVAAVRAPHVQPCI